MTNLFANPNWRGGHTTKTDAQGNELTNIWIPDRWAIWYAAESTAKIDRQDDPWIPPEVLIKGAEAFPPSELDTILRGNLDNKLLAVFRQYGRVWFSAHQTLTLQPGQYEMRVLVFPDHYVDYRQEGSAIIKTPPADPLASELSLFIGQQSTPYSDAANLPHLQWSSAAASFVVETAGAYPCGFSLRARWGNLNTGWFISDVSLTRTDTPGTPTPNPVPNAENQSPPADTLSLYQSLNLQLQLLENDVRRARWTLNSIKERYNLP